MNFYNMESKLKSKTGFTPVRNSELRGRDACDFGKPAHIPGRFLMGFTLIEMMISILIFGFMMMSMAAVYSTANKHMFQNYRQNRFKTQLTVAMKLIKNRFITATRIDTPSLTSSSGNILAFASNIDSNTGCYPIDNTQTPAWHYFCVTSCPASYLYPAGTPCLYYHTAPVNGGGTCPAGPAWVPGNNYPISCGAVSRAGETVAVIADNIRNLNANYLFYRSMTERNSVRVNMRVFWTPPAGAGYDLKRAARPVESTLDTYLSANMAVQ